MCKIRKTNRLLISGLICCMLLLQFTAAGCSKKAAATTAAVKTTGRMSLTAGKTTSKAGMPSSTVSGGTGSSAEEQQGSGAADPDTSSQTEENEPYIPVKSYDLGGRTVVWTRWGDPEEYRRWFEDEEFARTYTAEGNQITGHLYAVYKRMQEAQKKYNFKFKTNIWTNGVAMQDDFEKSAMAGIHVSDMLTGSSQRMFPAYITKKLILPLDDYYDLSEDLYHLKSNRLSMALNAWQGKQYGFSPFLITGTAYGVNCDLDMLGREGLPRPYDLILANQWNWDTFLSQAMTCTRDLNGDGILDQWGIVNYYQPLLIGMINSNGGQFLATKGDNDVSFALSDPKSLKGLQFANDLIHVYKVVRDKPYILAALFDKTSCFTVFSSYKWAYDARGITGMEWVPLPKGPDADTYQSVIPIHNPLIFPVTMTNAAEIINIMIEVFSYWDTTRPYSVDADAVKFQQLATWVQDEEIRRFSLGVVDQVRFDPYYGFSAVKTLIDNNILTPISKGAISVGSAVDSIRTQVQSEISDAMGRR
ncbi:MAG TPA: hypothetical protein DD727_00815 [Clostridiales bacterium]|nr:hypothetical protein [Clostridiales bacterium]